MLSIPAAQWKDANTLWMAQQDHITLSGLLQAS
jgi:hypothetical protein